MDEMTTFKTPKQIIKQANDLAREFYRLRGYVAPEDYRFDKATHPHEVACWQEVVLAYEWLTETELSEALNELEDGDEPDA